MLLEAATTRLARLGAKDLDAWTREDTAALHWYVSNGFAQTDRYLHVYANDETSQLCCQYLASMR